MNRYLPCSPKPHRPPGVGNTSFTRRATPSTARIAIPSGWAPAHWGALRQRDHKPLKGPLLLPLLYTGVASLTVVHGKRHIQVAVTTEASIENRFHGEVTRPFLLD